MFKKLMCVVGALACMAVSITALQQGIENPVNVETQAACAAQGTPSPEPSAAVAAMKTFDGLQTCLSARVDLYWTAYLQYPGTYAAAWDIGQIIEGSLATSMLPNGPTRAQTLSRLNLELHSLQYYWDSGSNPPGYDSSIRAPFGLGSAKFYDDNAWIGMALLQTYKYTHETSLLHQAEKVFTFEQKGAVGTEKYPHPGGEFWTQAPGDYYRATVSTAGSAELALQLYLVTGQKQDLAFAEKMYNWVNATLKAPDGLYHDGIQADGSIVNMKWSYNQGLMLGDATLLYKATGNSQYLTQAEAIAKAAVAYYSAGDKIWNQPPEFNAIFFKNLMQLDAVAPDPAYRALMKSYAQQIWAHVNPNTGVFFWKGTNKMLFQAAAVQIFAYLSLPSYDATLS